MKIAIFGSCVSRDTVEYMPAAKVVAYVARQSVTSLETPHKRTIGDLGQLDSAFQRAMVVNDSNGNGLDKLTTDLDGITVVLLDLVDERRGIWLFPNDTSMTNSIEFEACGGAREARRAGAKLLEFGTDRHFNRWKSGFCVLINGLKNAGLWDKTIFLDIEWAAAMTGSRFPRYDTVTYLGRAWRRLHRGSKEAAQVVLRGGGIGQAVRSLIQTEPTEAEKYADRARIANINYVRYRAFASQMTQHSIFRSSKQLRIGLDHKWGPEPFHYRDSDYRSIASEINHIINTPRQ